jgi:hypothetical protein
MKTPGHYNAVVNISFFLAAVIKGAFGVCWVLSYGKDTDQVATVNIEDPTFGKTATVFVIINAFLTLPLVMRVVSELFDHKLLKYFPHMDEDSGYNWLWLLITRPLLLGFGLLISLIVPQFGLVMGFLGNISGTFLSFICPWKNISHYFIFRELKTIHGHMKERNVPEIFPRNPMTRPNCGTMRLISNPKPRSRGLVMSNHNQLYPESSSMCGKYFRSLWSKSSDTTRMTSGRVRNALIITKTVAVLPNVGSSIFTVATWSVSLPYDNTQQTPNAPLITAARKKEMLTTAL